MTKGTEAQDKARGVERNERILAYAIVVAVAASVASFLGIIVGTWSGMSAADFGTGLWPVVAWTPYVLPLGIVLIIALVLSSARRRSAIARKSAK